MDSFSLLLICLVTQFKGICGEFVEFEQTVCTGNSCTNDNYFCESVYCYLTCTSTANCQNLNILCNSTHLNSTCVVDCNGGSCINITLESYVVTTDVTCDNTQNGDSACNQSNFYIYGSDIDTKSNNFSLLCTGDDPCPTVNVDCSSMFYIAYLSPNFLILM